MKLNSADFQRGGFSPDDAKQVVQMLNELDVDMVELSGGSYETPAMYGSTRDGRTLAREAYFLEFARDIQHIATMPLMPTGGIKRYSVAQEVLNSGVAVAGMATALAINPNLPNEWQQENYVVPELKPITWQNKPLASLAHMAAVKYQLLKHSKNRRAKPNVLPAWALLLGQIDNAQRSRAYRKTLANSSNS